MDGNGPLFSTCKPVGKDNCKLEPSRSPAQPQGHHDTHDQVLPGSWQSPPEGDLPPELVALRAQTRLWFEQTQARRLRTEVGLPAWFHGFISRRETEQLLQDQPLGCFLVRFSESTVGFVLSYRGRDRCRHFVLDQLPGGRYVILGEQSAHSELPELLQHYSLSPLAPYHEFLTVPRRRGAEPQGWTRVPGGSPTAPPPRSEALPTPPTYGTVAKGPAWRAGLAATDPPPVEPSTEGAASREAPSTPPPLPAKGSSSATALEGPYPQGHKEVPPFPTPPDSKYQQLLCFHTYAEPHEPRGRAEGEEPIPFYAVGRGSSPNPQENIYSEVALAQQHPPSPVPRGAQGACSTLPPKPRTHRQLFRSISSQGSRRWQVLGWGKERRSSGVAAEGQTPPVLELDDSVYGGRGRAATPGDPENIYEQLPTQQH